MQVPTLFYVVCLSMMVTGEIDHAQLLLAWIFVAARLLHAVVYIGWKLGARALRLVGGRLHDAGRDRAAGLAVLSRCAAAAHAAVRRRAQSRAFSTAEAARCAPARWPVLDKRSASSDASCISRALLAMPSRRNRCVGSPLSRLLYWHA
jgi:hypothetical protein